MLSSGVHLLNVMDELARWPFVLQLRPEQSIQEQVFPDLLFWNDAQGKPLLNVEVLQVRHLRGEFNSLQTPKFSKHTYTIKSFCRQYGIALLIHILEDPPMRIRTFFAAGGLDK